MKVLKHSKQREAIKAYLKSTTSHPTADMVYENVKGEFPNISLGTVYRNLNLLVDMDEAIKITTKDGSDRFDARTESHYHFVCTNCGRVKDLIMKPFDDIQEKASKCTKDLILDHEIKFLGICYDCQTDNLSK